jgi:hypothetical protein
MKEKGGREGETTTRLEEEGIERKGRPRGRNDCKTG